MQHSVAVSAHTAKSFLGSRNLALPATSANGTGGMRLDVFEPFPYPHDARSYVLDLRPWSCACPAGSGALGPPDPGRPLAGPPAAFPRPRDDIQRQTGANCLAMPNISA